MKIDQVIYSNIEAESELGQDFSSFLLRYNKDLDYSDFSDDEELIQRLRRAESYRQWADLEDLANSYETLAGSINSHKTTAAAAFQELYMHIDKFKKEISSKFND